MEIGNNLKREVGIREAVGLKNLAEPILTLLLSELLKEALGLTNLAEPIFT